MVPAGDAPLQGAATNVGRMTSRAPSVRMVTGAAELRSSLGSNQWELRQGDQVLATLRRLPRQHISLVELADGTQWRIQPEQWGIVVAIEDGEPFARIVRRSWWGRRWTVESQSFSLELVSRPRPRRWDIVIGGEPLAELSGSAVSYNRMKVDAIIGVPLVAVVLAWQVVVRPWEAAARPTELRPVPAPAKPQPSQQ